MARFKNSKFYTVISVLSISVLLLLYTNCGNSFESQSVNHSKFLRSINDKQSRINESHIFELTTKNNQKIQAYAFIDTFTVEFAENKSINVPKPILSGEVCIPALPSGYELRIKRSFKLSTQTNEESSDEQSYYYEGPALEMSQISSPGLCGGLAYKFSYSSSTDALKIKAQLLTTNNTLLVHNDFFIIDVNHSELKQGSAQSPQASQLQGGVKFVSNYEIKTPVTNEPLGIWSDWIKTKDGDCIDSLQKFNHARACEPTKVCLRDDGVRATLEEKTTTEACVFFGTWGNWLEISASDCENGSRVVKSRRTCREGLLCKDESNELVRTQDREKTEQCQPVTQPHDPEPPTTPSIKPMFSKNVKNLKVLFVGNSYHASAIPSKRKNGEDPDYSKSVRNEFRRLLEDNLQNPTVSSKSIGGGTLEMNWNGDARRELERGNYDLLIIQGRNQYWTSSPRYANDFNNYLDRFVNLARSKNTKVIVYGIWTTDQYIDKSGNPWGDIVNDIYGGAARRNKIAYAPNGMAHGLLYSHLIKTASEQEVEDKLTTDNTHANYAMVYMVINLLYGTVFGELPPANMYKRPQLSKQDADLGRRYAWEAILKYGYNGY